MAYFSQDMKKQIAPNVKAVCKRHGIKATLAVRNYATLSLTIQSGPIDFGTVGYNGYNINTYHYRTHDYNQQAVKFLDEVLAAMNKGNHDNSIIQVDYFDVGWYVDINVGKWDKPYLLTV